MAAEAAGLGFEQLVERIVGLRPGAQDQAARSRADCSRDLGDGHLGDHPLDDVRRAARLVGASKQKNA